MILYMTRYFKTFPCLRQPLSFTLLEKDFNCIYPDKENCMYIKWAQISASLLYLSAKKQDSYIKDVLQHETLNNTQSVNEVLALSILPLFSNCASIKCKNPGVRWRPSKIEMRNGFILHIKNIGDLQSSLEQRQEKLSTFDLTVQPIPVFGIIKQIILGHDQTVYFASQPCEIIKFESHVRAFEVVFPNNTYTLLIDK